MKYVMLAAMTAANLYAADAKKPYIPDNIRKLHEAIEECVGNGSGWLTNYNVKDFNAKTVLADMKNEDKEKGCTPSERRYSASKTDAMEMLRQMVTKGDAAECVAEYLSKAHMSTLMALTNPKGDLTAAMFATEYAGGADDSEACSYYHYDIYMKGGVRLGIVFDYTD